MISKGTSFKIEFWGIGGWHPVKLGWIFLRGGQGQVGKIKARLGLECCGATASSGDLGLGLDDMREPGEGRQLEARVHQAGHGSGHFGEGGPRQVHGGVAQRPLVQVYCVQCAETVQVGQAMGRVDKSGTSLPAFSQLNWVSDG